MVKRKNSEQIKKDLEGKMVFISGPRQAGKTTLAKSLREDFGEIDYLNYDSSKDREVFLRETWDREKSLIVLDEVHKHKNWKNKIKGIYDTEGNRPRILVTGSSLLNVRQKTGDSLAGRYHHHRLYPFSFNEIASEGAEGMRVIKDFLAYGNFPEPFLSQSETEAKRWRKAYLNLVMTQDLAEIGDIKDLSSMKLLVDLLRQRVGSPLSLNGIAHDLEISPNTVKRYIELLEQMFLIFRVTPFHRNIARAILKEPKIYFYDIGLVKGNLGLRFENLVALHLLKHLHYREDVSGEDVGLHYIRDRQKHEVDFFYKESEEDPGRMLEVKLSETKADKNLRYFQERLGFEARQVVLNSSRTLQEGKVRIIPATDFFASLFI